VLTGAGGWTDCFDFFDALSFLSSFLLGLLPNALFPTLCNILPAWLAIPIPAFPPNARPTTILPAEVKIGKTASLSSPFSGVNPRREISFMMILCLLELPR